MPKKYHYAKLLNFLYRSSTRKQIIIRAIFAGYSSSPKSDIYEAKLILYKKYPHGIYYLDFTQPKKLSVRFKKHTSAPEELIFTEYLHNISLSTANPYVIQNLLKSNDLPYRYLFDLKNPQLGLQFEPITLNWIHLLDITYNLICKYVERYNRPATQLGLVKHILKSCSSMGKHKLLYALYFGSNSYWYTIITSFPSGKHYGHATYLYFPKPKHDIPKHPLPLPTAYRYLGNEINWISHPWELLHHVTQIPRPRDTKIVRIYRTYPD